MNQRSGRLAAFYHRLLHLYPPQFREEYLEEMAVVFELQLAANGDLNIWQSLALTWRELIPLPGLLITAHLRERRQKRMKTTVNRWFAQADPGSWSELVLAGIPFLLMGILPGLFSLIPAIKDLPPKYGIPILILLAMILAGLGIIGLLVNLPRWSMIYAGILIALLPLSILVFSVSLEILPTPPGWGSIPTTAVTLAIFLIVQFLLAGLLIWLSGKMKLTLGFHHRVRSDPSLLALLFYGGTFFIMMINYDDISQGGYYQIPSSAVMVIGAWGFLKAVNPRRKLLALTAGLTIAAILALVANLTLVEYASPQVAIGPVYLPRPVIFVGMTWLVALAMILIPPLLFKSSPPAVEA